MNANPITHRVLSVLTPANTFLQESLEERSAELTSSSGKSSTELDNSAVNTARKMIALSGNPIQETDQASNLIITLTDINVGDALYARTKKITTEGKNLLSIRINRNLLEALEDSAHPKHKIAQEIINRQLLFGKQEAINPVTPDGRVMSVDEYIARVGLERLKIGFYDTAFGSKRDKWILNLETFIAKGEFEKAKDFVKENFMQSQEASQLLNDYKTTGKHLVQRYSELVFDLPGKKIPVKIMWHSSLSIVAAYEKTIAKLKSLREDLANLNLNRTQAITILENASFAGLASDNGEMFLVMRDSDTPLWISRTIKHEEQHFKTRRKLGDGTSSSHLWRGNETQPHDLSYPSEKIFLRHRFIGGNIGKPKLLLSELLSYRVECEQLFKKINEPGFLESSDCLNLLDYRRGAKTAIKQLEAINSSDLSPAERKHLFLIKKSWENLDKKLEPYLEKILKQISGHSDRRFRKEEYHLLIEQHKKAGQEGEYPEYLGMLIDYETNYMFLEDIVEAPAEEFPLEFQERAARRYMSTKFQGDQKDWKITLNRLLSSEDIEVRKKGYRYAIESFKLASNEENKAEFLKKFSDSICKEEDHHLLEEMILSSEEEVPQEFQDLAAKRYMSLDWFYAWKVALHTLLEKNDYNSRQKGYKYLVESYINSSEEKKLEYLELFKLYVNNEGYFYLLHALGRGQDVPTELQKVAQERFIEDSMKSDLTERLPKMFSDKRESAYKYCADFYEWTSSQEEKNLYYSLFEGAVNSTSDGDFLKVLEADKEIPEVLRSLATKRLLELA